MTKFSPNCIQFMLLHFIFHFNLELVDILGGFCMYNQNNFCVGFRVKLSSFISYLVACVFVI